MSLPTVAVAECVTCGTVAAEFGKVWGASAYFKGGLVCYDSDIKIKYLNVPEELAKNFTDHPAQVVIDMAKGITKLFDSDVGMSTSGYATPYSPKNVTVPYIWYAIYDRKKDRIVEVDKVVNHEYLGRGEFQHRVAMLVHVKYMIYFRDYTAKE